jgi:uncharacterized membrane protein YkgB
MATQTLTSDEGAPFRVEPVVIAPSPDAVLQPAIRTWDDCILIAFQRWSVPALRIAMGLVFLWFGALKVFGVSPVTPMLKATYSFMTMPAFIVMLGAWEILIGFGMVFKLALRHTLLLLCLHLMGTLTAVWLAPSYFFVHGNPLVLTVSGEFVAKNLVFLMAGFVIAGHECLLQKRPRRVSDPPGKIEDAKGTLTVRERAKIRVFP